MRRLFEIVCAFSLAALAGVGCPGNDTNLAECITEGSSLLGCCENKYVLKEGKEEGLCECLIEGVKNKGTESTNEVKQACCQQYHTGYLCSLDPTGTTGDNPTGDPVPTTTLSMPDLPPDTASGTSGQDMNSTGEMTSTGMDSCMPGTEGCKCLPGTDLCLSPLTCHKGECVCPTKSEGCQCAEDDSCDPGLTCDTEKKLCYCPTGHNGCQCYGNHTCNDNLECGKDELCHPPRENSQRGDGHK